MEWFTFLAVAALAISAAAGERHAIGFRSTTVASGDTVKCFQNKEIHNEDNILYSYINIRVGDGNGAIRAGLDTLNNAQDNIHQTDVLIDLCPKKTINIYNTVSNILGSIGVLNNVDHIFMSAVVTDEDCWHLSGSDDDFKTNIAALNDGMKAIRDQEKYLGVKTNRANWTAITDNWTGISAGGWQLWWVSEGPASFDGFEPFGGWSGIPALRQYQANTTKCNTAVDLNVGRGGFICSKLGQDCDEGCCTAFMAYCHEDTRGCYP